MRLLLIHYIWYYLLVVIAPPQTLANKYLHFEIGYDTTDFTSAVNLTLTIPPLDDAELFQVLYECEDTDGLISGIEYCQSGCTSVDNDTLDDYCV
jgi:hypothetical protein